LPYLLNLLYLLLLLVASPWLIYYAWRKGKYREGYAEKVLGRVPVRPPERDGERRPCLWLHAVSVGEVNLLSTLVRRIERAHPDWRCVISTTTRTGMELARKRFPDRLVFYCPLDFSWAVGQAMRRIRPDVVVLTELELWPNLIRAAKRQGAAVAVINGRLSEKSFQGYRRVRHFLRGVLRQLDIVAAQDEAYAERFRQLGVPGERVAVTGSMKFDGVQTDRDNPQTRELIAVAGFARDDAIFLAGSTQDPEERVALNVWRRLSTEFPHLRLVIVPRHPERFDEVARLLDRAGVAWHRRSELTDSLGAAHNSPASVATASGSVGVSASRGAAVRGSAGASASPGDSEGKPGVANRRSDDPSPGSGPRSPDILLVDTVGELGAWWGTARIAYVGGSMGSRGGQNMIEPAAYGAAVSFGPNTRNFRDIVAALLRRDAAVVVADERELEQFVRRCLTEPAWAGELGDRARCLVAEQQGATGRTVELLARLVSP